MSFWHVINGLTLHSELPTQEFQTILRPTASFLDKCGLSLSLVLVYLYSDLKCYNNIHKQSAIVYNKSEKSAINILGW